jgi:hypothetical protein
MATKISDLSGIVNGNDGMELVVNDAGTSKKLTGAQVRDYTFSEIDGLTSQTVAEDANLVLIRDGSDSKKLTLRAIRRLTDGKVGTYSYYDADFPGAPALDSWWKLADGSLISDAESPFNGYRSRNYNGADVVLTGIVWASGVATIPATDVTALAIGDDVSGGAIAANTYISNIVGTTVTLTDTAISATVDTTFTNNGRFLRGGAVSGVGEKDQTQRLFGEIPVRIRRLGSANGVYSGSAEDINAEPGATSNSITTLEFDSANSSGSRTSTDVHGETRVTNTRQAVIFKIK